MNVTFVGKYDTLLYTHSLHVHQIFSCKTVCVSVSMSVCAGPLLQSTAK